MGSLATTLSRVCLWHAESIRNDVPPTCSVRSGCESAGFPGGVKALSRGDRGAKALASASIRLIPTTDAISGIRLERATCITTSIVLEQMRSRLMREKRGFLEWFA